MSFLTPLYILGLAAISLPILFHLIRRTPKGVQQFSSLMFISPTPPRLTRRSRLDQILLLLLRAAVIGLLAFAFARPFLRLTAATDLSDVSQRIFAVLVDTSGSMQRDGMWQQVEAELDAVLNELGPQDAIALYTFGGRSERIVTIEESESLTAAGRRELVKRRFAQLRPGWGETLLGEAMILAADDLDAVLSTNPQAVLRQLIVITDAQQGSHVESLQGYQWPRNVQVVFRRTESLSKGNASLAVLDTPAESDDDRGIRVRVANSLDATQQHFEVGWSDQQQGMLGRPVGISVPAGETRVLHVPQLAPDAVTTHVELTGDAHEFDNRYFVASATRSTVSIAYPGQAAGDDPEQMLYYLQRAVTNDQWISVDIVTELQVAVASMNEGQVRLLVVSEPLSAEWLAASKVFLQEGGTVLLAFSDAESAKIAAQLGAGTLGEAESKTPDDYLMWSDIDFDSRLFRPFASPRFSDFSKIRFWKYARVNPPAASPWRTVVQYDNGDSALLEMSVGQGTLYVLTSTWRPEESQLARSSKFVPLLLRLLGTETSRRVAGYVIGESITLQRSSAKDRLTVTKPDGTVVPVASDVAEFSDTDQPGLYRLQTGDVQKLVAVNVARRETRTAPLDLTELEQRGVQLGEASTYAEELEALRQMRDIELESRQGAWRWLIAAALLLVIAETVLAGRWSMQSSEVAATDSTAPAAGDA